MVVKDSHGTKSVDALPGKEQMWAGNSHSAFPSDLCLFGVLPAEAACS